MKKTTIIILMMIILTATSTFAYADTEYFVYEYELEFDNSSRSDLRIQNYVTAPFMKKGEQQVFNVLDEAYQGCNVRSEASAGYISLSHPDSSYIATDTIVDSGDSFTMKYGVAVEYNTNPYGLVSDYTYEFVPDNILRKYLKPTSTIDCENSLIVNTVNSIVGRESNSMKKASKIYSYITNNFIRNNDDVIRSCSASESLEYVIAGIPHGVCTHNAQLSVALLRAAGIPARTCEGWSTTDSSYIDGWKNGERKNNIMDIGAHEWAEFYVEPYGWIHFDGSTNLNLFGNTELTSSTSIYYIKKLFDVADFTATKLYGDSRLKTYKDFMGMSNYDFDDKKVTTGIRRFASEEECMKYFNNTFVDAPDLDIVEYHDTFVDGCLDWCQIADTTEFGW